MDATSTFTNDWGAFFTEISSFLSRVKRQRGFANEQFCEYAVERLEMLIVSVSSLTSRLGANLPSSEASSRLLFLKCVWS